MLSKIHQTTASIFTVTITIMKHVNYLQAKCLWNEGNLFFTLICSEKGQTLSGSRCYELLQSPTHDERRGRTLSEQNLFQLCWRTHLTISNDILWNKITDNVIHIQHFGGFQKIINLPWNEESHLGIFTINKWPVSHPCPFFGVFFVFIEEICISLIPPSDVTIRSESCVRIAPSLCCFVKRHFQNVLCAKLTKIHCKIQCFRWLC